MSGDEEEGLLTLSSRSHTSYILKECVFRAVHTKIIEQTGQFCKAETDLIMNKYVRIACAINRKVREKRMKQV